MSARSPTARSELPRRSVPTTPVFGEAAMDLAAVLFELRRDDVGGPLLLKAELGMGVDVAADPAQLVVEVENAGEDRHRCSSLRLATIRRARRC